MTTFAVVREKKPTIMARKMKSPTHGEHLLEQLSQLLPVHQQNQPKYSDIKVKIGHKIFHCHRLIMALMSPYFDRQLNSSSSQNKDEITISMSDIKEEAFESVLCFIYTGEVELGEENVEKVLRAADVFMLTELHNVCVDFILTAINTDNCLKFWKLAHELNLATLDAACRRVAVTDPVKITSSNDLGELTEKMIRELLEDSGLMVEREANACEMLVKWLDKQTQNGHTVQLPYQLLATIRWSAVSVQHVKSKLLTHPVLANDPQCFEFLSKVVSYHNSGIQFEGLRTFHRKSTSIEQSVVLVGFDTGNRIASEVYILSLQRHRDAYKSDAISTKMQMEAFACVCNDQLYVTGVGSTSRETWTWDDIVGWTRCGDMIQGRRRHYATFVGNTTMFALGGWEKSANTSLKSVEEYSTTTNEWTEAGHLVRGTWAPGCVNHETSIYVFGGRNEQREIDLDCVQVYDTSSKQCTVLTQRLPRATRLLRAVMWDKSVILVNHRTCLIFDVEQQTFQTRKQFAAGVSHFGLVLENQRLFIIGGGVREEGEGGKVTWTCSDEVKSVDVMDIITNQQKPTWTQHFKLPAPAAVDAFAVMTLPIE